MTEREVGLLLLNLALVIAVARLAGLAARSLRQPAVIGEIVAGIVLGPTLWHGDLARLLFSLDVRPMLAAFADLGLMLFMFGLGMEMEHAKMRRGGRVATTTALCATALPFGAGMLLALWLAGHHTTTSRSGFVLFIGVALSITAFPVLARIIAELRLGTSAIGTIALSCAAFCDVAAWSMLALVQASTGRGHSYWPVLLLVPFAAFMVGVVRPVLRWVLARRDATGGLPAGAVAVVFVGLLASSAVTQFIGLHFVFGAFLFGLVMPRSPGPALHESVIRPIEFTTALLLPVYFVVAGANVDVSRFGAAGALDLLVVVTLAVIAKFGGAFAGARLSGLATRGSAVLATMLNTRGLTELIALEVGLRAGLLDQQLYGVMVVMAVITTAMTGPLLRLLLRSPASGGEETTELCDLTTSSSRPAPSRPVE